MYYMSQRPGSIVQMSHSRRAIAFTHFLAIKLRRFSRVNRMVPIKYPLEDMLLYIAVVVPQSTTWLGVAKAVDSAAGRNERPGLGG